VGITTGSREVPGRNACDRRHTYRIIILITTHQPMYWRMKISSCTGIAAY